MASLLARAPVMIDRPQAVANAKFLIVANNNKTTTICDRDVPLFLEGRQNAFYKGHVERIACSLCETAACFKRVLRLRSSSETINSKPYPFVTVR
jgi:hypothetical protein